MSPPKACGHPAFSWAVTSDKASASCSRASPDCSAAVLFSEDCRPRPGTGDVRAEPPPSPCIKHPPPRSGIGKGQGGLIPSRILCGQRVSRLHPAPPLPILTWELWEQGLVRTSDAFQWGQADAGPLHGGQCQQQGTAQQHCRQHDLASSETHHLVLPHPCTLQVPSPRKRLPREQGSLPNLRTYLCLLDPCLESFWPLRALSLYGRV